MHLGGYLEGKLGPFKIHTWQAEVAWVGGSGSEAGGAGEVKGWRGWG